MARTRIEQTNPNRVGPTRTIPAIVAALMWGPKTQAELAEITGATVQAVRWNLQCLHLEGVIYVYSGNVVGRKWGLQSKPFAEPDAQPPKSVQDRHRRERQRAFAAKQSATA